MTAQYRRASAAAGDAVKEMVIFGLMLDKVEAELSATRKRAENGAADFSLPRQTKIPERGRPSENTLKAWLAEHCPEVNYKTALDYRAAVRGVRKLAHLEGNTPLLPLLGAEPLADEKLEDMRKSILKLIAGSSLRVLREAARGNPNKGLEGVLKGRRALTAEEKVAAATQLLHEVSGHIDAYIRAGWASFTTQEERDSLVRVLKAAIKSLAEVTEARG